jgi:scyllo-inositol 2-dehydrogenase (NADP+)
MASSSWYVCVQVWAHVRTEREGNVVDDAFDVTLQFPSPAPHASGTPLLVQLGAGMLFAAKRPRMALYGTKGAYVKHGIDPQVSKHRIGQRSSDCQPLCAGGRVEGGGPPWYAWLG